MNRLSTFLPALTLALALTLPGTAHTPKAATGQTAAPKEKARFDLTYYWYTYPADAFFDHQTLLTEELEWWIILGDPIDTDPSGGTLIARGYLTKTYPHTSFASIYLYAHE
jgi:hypothetical protein